MASASDNHDVNLLRTYQYPRQNEFAHLYMDPRYAHHFPFFGFNTIDIMLRDSRIQYALGLLKGPIYSYTKFYTAEESEDKEINQAIIDNDYHFPFKVTAKDPETEKFIVKMYKRFWIDGLMKALRAIEWGYAPHQTIYQRNSKGQIEYKTMQAYSPKECHPLSRGNELVGCYLEKIHRKIRIPKAFVHIQRREDDQYVGRSRLKNCHVPWHEAWTRGGARDTRRIWYFRNSYDSGTLYVPGGSTTDPQTGATISNIELGINIMESTMTGSYRVLPQDRNMSDGKNNRLWEYDEPSSRRAPDGMRDYIQDLKHEYLEGMGIPPEVVDTDTGGIGSATGRKVPFVAFLSTLQPIGMEVIKDFDEQVCRTLAYVNRMDEDYEIEQMIPKDYSDSLAAEANAEFSERDPQTETTI